MVSLTVGIDYYMVIDAPDPVLQMQIWALDPELYRAPCSLTIQALGGAPGAEVDILIDGEVVAENCVLDSEGAIGPLSVLVPSDTTSGEHDVSISGSGLGGTSTFTIEKNPSTAVDEGYNVGNDTAPVLIPGAVVNGVHRWVFQDLMPGGLGSWIFPANPVSTDPWPFHKAVEAMPNIRGNKVHVTGRGPVAHDWSFSGVGRDEATYSSFVAYAALNRRFYLIDHRGRAWNYTITSFEPEFRLRTQKDDGTYTDWMFDYTIAGVIFGDEWLEPES